MRGRGRIAPSEMVVKDLAIMEMSLLSLLRLVEALKVDTKATSTGRVLTVSDIILSLNPTSRLLKSRQLKRKRPKPPSKLRLSTK